MSTQLALFSNAAVPAYLQATPSGVTASLVGGLGEGGGNRIGLKGSRFRLIEAGEEVAVKNENHLDVVIVGANPGVSRSFYEGTYDPTVPQVAPACWSSDGVKPDPKSEAPQAARCVSCPQNVKGSKVQNGIKMKACGFSKRLAVVLVGDAERKVYALNVKAKSIFGTGTPQKNLYSFSEFARLLAGKGARSEGLVTQLSFDVNESVPKLLFSPVSFLSEVEFREVIKISQSEEVSQILKLDMKEVVSGDGDAVAPAPAPAPAPKCAAPPPVVHAKGGLSEEDLAAQLGDFDDE